MATRVYINQSIIFYVAFSEKDDELGFILKLQVVFKKLFFKWEKVENFVRKPKYVISLELICHWKIVQIIKIFVKNHI